jgi:hypothetical protein
MREGTGVVVHDSGASLQAGAHCEFRDPYTAVCAAGLFIEQARAELGDGSDRARVAPSVTDLTLTAVGGAGNDTLGAVDVASNQILTGGAGDDRLVGGGGWDDLRGGPGTDVLAAGAGNDELDGGLGGDQINGGAGRDRMSYNERRTPVEVDLARGFESGDGDVIAAVESVVGGRGDDLLTGSVRRDELLGGGGDDHLRGRSGGDVLAGEYRTSSPGGDDVLDGGAGNDALHGEGGDDRLVGGAGRDRLEGDQGANLLFGGPGDDYLEPNWSFTLHNVGARWTCGSGRDRVLTHLVAFTLPRDCERLVTKRIRLERLPRTARAIRIALDRGSPRRCRVSVSIAGTAVLSLDRGTPRTLPRPGQSRSMRLRFAPATPCRAWRFVVRVRF